MKQLVTTLFTAACLLLINSAYANEKALDLDALLQKLEQGQFAQTEANKAREANFIAERSTQD